MSKITKANVKIELSEDEFATVMNLLNSGVDTLDCGEGYTEEEAKEADANDPNFSLGCKVLDKVHNQGLDQSSRYRTWTVAKEAEAKAVAAKYAADIENDISLDIIPFDDKEYELQRAKINIERRLAHEIALYKKPDDMPATLIK